MDFKILFLM